MRWRDIAEARQPRPPKTLPELNRAIAATGVTVDRRLGGGLWVETNGDGADLAAAMPHITTFADASRTLLAATVDRDKPERAEAFQAAGFVRDGKTSSDDAKYLRLYRTPKSAASRPQSVVEQQPNKQWLYHGTSLRDAAWNILRRGLQPRSDTGVSASGHGWTTPIEGSVYLTKNLERAVRYAIKTPNGNGSRTSEGFVFVIDPDTIKPSDMHPDEDEVAQFLTSHTRVPWDFDIGARNAAKAEFISRSPAEDQAADREVWQFIRAATGDRGQQFIRKPTGSLCALVGKMALQNMPEWMQHRIIQSGENVAVRGGVMPVEGWRIDTRLTQRALAFDASNFFELAERL